MSITQSIVLVGMPGSGKSTIGKRLANVLFLDFYDSDRVIEKRVDIPIAKIVLEKGNDYMRARERETISEIIRYGSPVVLATGGNAFMDQTIRDDLLQHCIVIWIKADYDILYKRIIRRDTRPEFHNADTKTLLRNMLHERQAIYSKAHIIIENHDQSVYELTKELKKSIMQYINSI